MDAREALHYIQQNIDGGRTEYNKKFGSYHRSAEGILGAARPHLKHCKANLTLKDELVIVAEGTERQEIYIKATVTLSIDPPVVSLNPNEATTTAGTTSIEASALAREARESEKTERGFDRLAPPQLTGTASSYARKYALQGLFAMSDRQDDPDNAEAGADEAAPQQAPPGVPTQDPRLPRISALCEELGLNGIQKLNLWNRLEGDFARIEAELLEMKKEIE